MGLRLLLLTLLPPAVFPSLQNATGAATPAEVLCASTACSAWRATCCRMECARRPAPLALFGMETDVWVSPAGIPAAAASNDALTYSGCC